MMLHPQINVTVDDLSARRTLMLRHLLQANVTTAKITLTERCINLKTFKVSLAPVYLS